MEELFMLTADKILSKATAYGVSTLDCNGFPKTTVFSKMLSHFGFATLYFYVKKESETVKNIQINPRGSVICHATLAEGELTTLNLKGTFTLVEVAEAQEISEDIQIFDEILKHEQPAILLFETLCFEAETTKKLY